MKLLVAGATGAIGSPLIRCLKESGHSVFGLVRSSDSNGALVEMGAEAVTADVLDAASIVSRLVRIGPVLSLRSWPAAARNRQAISRNSSGIVGSQPTTYPGIHPEEPITAIAALTPSSSRRTASSESGPNCQRPRGLSAPEFRRRIASTLQPRTGCVARNEPCVCQPGEGRWATP
jgi:hypothetical protein